jgi:hypothetical protein
VGKENKLSLAKRKGWIGFVWGYKDWVKSVIETGRWEEINWSGEHGAKEVVKSGNKTIYKF